MESSWTCSHTGGKPGCSTTNANGVIFCQSCGKHRSSGEWKCKCSSENNAEYVLCSGCFQNSPWEEAKILAEKNFQVEKKRVKLSAKMKCRECREKFLDETNKSEMAEVCNSCYDKDPARFRREMSRKRFLTAQEALVRKQPGDGNCLFHSLASELNMNINETIGVLREVDAYADKWDHSLMRRAICRYLRQNPAIIEGFEIEVGSADDRADRMSRLGEWGEATEVRCCAQMTGVVINIYRPQRDGFELCMTCDVDDGKEKNMVCNVSWSEIHYDALEVRRG